MILKKTSLFFIFFYLTLLLNSQVSNPKIWLFGYQTPERDTTSLDTGFFKKAGLNIIDFRYNPIKQSRIAHGLSLGACSAFIYDRYDSLILYSNGSKVFNKNHRLIEGADSLSYGSLWETSLFSGNYYAEYYIRIFQNAILLLPDEYSKDFYYLVSVFLSGDSVDFHKIVYSTIDMSMNNGLGRMTSKEKTIKLGSFTEAIAACKHGNGKDWWIIAREYINKLYSVFLLDSLGVKIHSENQLSEFDISDRDAGNRNLCSKFSWNGEYFASYSHKGLEVYDFNRCTGKLSNRKEFIIPPNDSFGNNNFCFSPNDQFIYALTSGKVYQIDLEKNIIRKVGDWDYGRDNVDSLSGFYTNTYFHFPQLAADGKIYISTVESTKFLHVIESPNDTGILCKLKQKAIKLENNNQGLPSFPNYELKAISGGCDGSGIVETRKEDVVIYPNPASSIITIESKSKMISYELYDMVGRLVKSDKLIINYDIKVSELENGIYLFKIKLENGHEVQNKIEIRK